MKMWLKETRTLTIPDGILLQADMSAIGQAAVSAVRDRVKRYGLGSDDAFMPRYTPAYAKRRGQHGRQSEYRDLTMSGDMLKAIHVFGVTRHVVSIGITDPRNQVKAAAQQQRHPFLGIAASDWPMLSARITDRLEKRAPMLRFTRSATRTIK